MATIEGARALGQGEEVGTLESGKRADLIIIELERLHLTPIPDIISTIVYAAEAADVKTVLIDGQIVMRDGELATVNEREVITEARTQSARLFERAALG